MPASSSAKARGREAANPLKRVNPIAPNMERSTRDLTDDDDVEVVERVVEVEKIVEVYGPAVMNDTETGIVWVGNIGISSVGMYTNGEVTEDEWLRFLPAAKQIKSAYQWIIGDWAAYGEQALGKTYAEIAKLSGYKEGTIEVYASVCRSVDKLIRINSLGIAIHQAVAMLSHDDQAYWLQRAYDEKLSKSELKILMAGGKHEPRKIGKTTIDRFQRALTPFQMRAQRIAKKAAPEHRKEMADWLRELAKQIEKDK